MQAKKVVTIYGGIKGCGDLWKQKRLWRSMQAKKVVKIYGSMKGCDKGSKKGCDWQWLKQMKVARRTDECCHLQGELPLDGLLAN